MPALRGEYIMKQFVQPRVQRTADTIEQGCAVFAERRRGSSQNTRQPQRGNIGACPMLNRKGSCQCRRIEGRSRETLVAPWSAAGGHPRLIANCLTTGMKSQICVAMAFIIVPVSAQRMGDHTRHTNLAVCRHRFQPQQPTNVSEITSTQMETTEFRELFFAGEQP